MASCKYDTLDKTRKGAVFMYEYTFYRIPSPATQNTIANVEGRAALYLDCCRQVIIEHAQEGWRFVEAITSFGRPCVAELVFERPVPNQK